MSKEPLVGWQTNNLIGFLRCCAMHNAHKRKYAQHRAQYEQLYTFAIEINNIWGFSQTNHSLLFFLHTFCLLKTCGIINLALYIKYLHKHEIFRVYFKSVFPRSARKMQSMPQPHKRKRITRAETDFVLLHHWFCRSNSSVQFT